MQPHGGIGSITAKDAPPEVPEVRPCHMEKLTASKGCQSPATHWISVLRTLHACNKGAPSLVTCMGGGVQCDSTSHQHSATGLPKPPQSASCLPAPSHTEYTPLCDRARPSTAGRARRGGQPRVMGKHVPRVRIARFLIYIYIEKLKYTYKKG